MTLPAEVAHALHTHLRAELPRECCGFLLGTRMGNGMIITHSVPTLNAEPGCGAFAIPDVEVQRVRDLATREGMDVLALYHSHPGGNAALSASDAAALRCSEWPWLIITEGDAIEPLRSHWHTAGG